MKSNLKRLSWTLSSGTVWTCLLQGFLRKFLPLPLTWFLPKLTKLNNQKESHLFLVLKRRRTGFVHLLCGFCHVLFCAQPQAELKLNLQTKSWTHCINFSSCRASFSASLDFKSATSSPGVGWSWSVCSGSSCSAGSATNRTQNILYVRSAAMLSFQLCCFVYIFSFFFLNYCSNLNILWVVLLPFLHLGLPPSLLLDQCLVLVRVFLQHVPQLSLLPPVW